MKLTKKLLCLGLACILTVGQVPVMSMAATTKTVRNNKDYLYFEEGSISITSKKQVDELDELDSMLSGDYKGPGIEWESSDEKLLSVEDNGKLTLNIEENTDPVGEVIKKDVDISASLRKEVSTESEIKKSSDEATPSEIVCIATLKAHINVKNGWFQTQNSKKWSYFDRGEQVKSALKEIGGKTYFLGKDGFMVTDAYLETADGKSKRYFGEDGVMVVDSWKRINGVWKYFDEDGVMLIDTLFTFADEDGKENTYYFDSDGIMVTNKTILLDGTYYMFNDEGILIKTWKESSDNNSSSGGGESGGSEGTNSSKVETLPSGATVNTSGTTGPNGETITTAVISLGGKTMNVIETATKLADGSIKTEYKVTGDVSGLTFAGVGTVSQDGSTLTTQEGLTLHVTNAAMIITKAPDGTTLGYFEDPATGMPMATGTVTVLMQLGMDGQMHGHFINPQGYFYTGEVILNGMKILFDEEGVMLSFESLA
ncbi:N-acetylmuramoyl-L-alanine amidase family protein [Oribacterium sp. P6A1]|uniref:N-acetylmuramoyl-L-alanine amidase family protein n=1 Tax=Oribacterium sp. P6A1 TaxID=1410612 RepID=UPI00068D6BB8|nr:hypothetical protein [Oribacterium sp. P6A1]